MDFLLPDNDTMEVMRQEFARVCGNKSARTLACADENLLQDHYIEGVSAPLRTAVLLLFLYFITQLRYNVGYGTQIFDSDRSMGRLRPIRSALGKLNNLI